MVWSVIAQTDLKKHVYGSALQVPDKDYIDFLGRIHATLNPDLYLEMMMFYPVQAERVRQTQVWSGDVWKVYEILSMAWYHIPLK